MNSTIVGCCAVFVLLTACDYTFDPLLPNDSLHYSIYGTLDAAADSQIIRVGPVRTTILTTPDPIDATVTLEHLGSGTTVTLKDSLYQYGEDSWAWNYITDMDIEPEESYRLTATRSDGKSSYTIATLPGEYPDPRYVVRCFQSPPTVVEVYIDDVDRLVAMNVFYYYKVGDQEVIQSAFIEHIEHVSNLSGGGQNLVFNIQEDLEQIAENRRIDRDDIEPVKFEVYMVSAGPDWPVTEGVSLEEITLPGEAKNVENGLGLMAGIVSKTFELEHNCILP